MNASYVVRGFTGKDSEHCWSGNLISFVLGSQENSKFIGDYACVLMSSEIK